MGRVRNHPSFAKGTQRLTAHTRLLSLLLNYNLCQFSHCERFSQPLSLGKTERSSRAQEAAWTPSNEAHRVRMPAQEFFGARWKIVCNQGALRRRDGRVLTKRARRGAMESIMQGKGQKGGKSRSVNGRVSLPTARLNIGLQRNTDVIVDDLRLLARNTEHQFGRSACTVTCQTDPCQSGGSTSVARMSGREWADGHSTGTYDAAQMLGHLAIPTFSNFSQARIHHHHQSQGVIARIITGRPGHGTAPSYCCRGSSIASTASQPWRLVRLVIRPILSID